MWGFMHVPPLHAHWRLVGSQGGDVSQVGYGWPLMRLPWCHVARASTGEQQDKREGAKEEEREREELSPVLLFAL